MRPVAFLIPTFLVLLAHPLFAQGDTISRNPKCVQLRTIWKLEGEVPHAQVGNSFGSVGDVNGDGLGDFAVLSAIPFQWRVFYGSSDTISTSPVWTFDSASMDYPPIVGDFYGTGHNVVGFTVRRAIGPTQTPYNFLHLFRTDSSYLAAEPSIVWPMVSWQDTTQRAFGDDFIAADLDEDGDDELIYAARSVTGQGSHGRIWIYNGGPDFQMDTPDVVINDPLPDNDFYRLHVGDIDGNGRVDLMSVKSQNEFVIWAFYWGKNGWPTAGRQPDRSVDKGVRQTFDGSTSPHLADVDGDNIMDIVVYVARIWRSGSGKDPHTRSWTNADADIYLRSAGGTFGPGGRPGYLNSKQYEMVATAWAPGKVYFSGGPNGPDRDYDAIFYPGNAGLDGPVGEARRLGDVNGDGWDDAITGEGLYPDRWWESGITMIIAGGPYIPNDEPTVSVQEVALENHTDALSLWPNPVREKLNIAWRGDLARMPRRFEIRNMLGQLVTQGTVPDGDGAALWNCREQPAGPYLLSVYSDNDVLVATTRF
jgi:hypothetical protein